MDKDKWISNKISHLIKVEGKPRNQAVAIAHSMWRSRTKKAKIIMVTKAARTSYPVINPPSHEPIKNKRFLRESDLVAWAQIEKPSPNVNDVDPVELDEGTRFEMHIGKISQADAEQVAVKNLSMVPDYYTKLRRARRAAYDAAKLAETNSADARGEKP